MGLTTLSEIKACTVPNKIYWGFSVENIIPFCTDKNCDMLFIGADPTCLIRVALSLDSRLMELRQHETRLSIKPWGYERMSRDGGMGVHGGDNDIV